MLEVVTAGKAPIHCLPLLNNKVSPEYSFRIFCNTFFTFMVKIAAITKADFSKINKHPDVVFELALTHFWLAYLYQHEKDTYKKLLSMDAFIHYLKETGFPQNTQDKLLEFFKEFIDSEWNILKLFNGLSEKIIRQKISSLPALLEKNPQNQSLLKTLQDYATVPERAMGNISLTAGGGLKPRPLGAEDELTLPEHLNSENYVNLTLASIGLPNIQVKNPETVGQRIVYLQEIIASDSQILKKMESKKNANLTNVIDKHKKELLFLETVIDYHNKESKTESLSIHLSRSKFLSPRYVAIAHRVLNSPSSIINTEKKIKFLIQVVALFEGIQEKLSAVSGKLFEAAHPNFNMDAEFAKLGIFGDVEWPEPSSDSSDTVEASDSDSSKENQSENANSENSVICHSLQSSQQNPSNPIADLARQPFRQLPLFR